MLECAFSSHQSQNRVGKVPGRSFFQWPHFAYQQTDTKEVKLTSPKDYHQLEEEGN